MTFLAFLLFGLPFAMALTLSWHPALGRYRTSALNPLLLIAAYIVLIAGDFASIAWTGSGLLANRVLSTTSGTLSPSPTSAGRPRRPRKTRVSRARPYS